MSKNEKFCIKHEELFINENDEFCSPAWSDRPPTGTNCNINANLFWEFSIENAEMMENYPWNMMIFS